MLTFAMNYGVASYIALTERMCRSLKLRYALHLILHRLRMRPIAIFGGSC